MQKLALPSRYIYVGGSHGLSHPRNIMLLRLLTVYVEAHEWNYHSQHFCGVLMPCAEKPATLLSDDVQILLGNGKNSQAV
jgi:hypothetical protein